MSGAPRIDTLRNQIALTMDLLQILYHEAEDLHLLAYERRVAASERVRTSTTGYALDTHGDPKARDAYRRLAGALLAATEPLTNAARDARLICTEGNPPGPNRLHPRTATTAEVAAAIGIQVRRRGRGDYTPHRTWPQPRVGT